MSRPPEIEAPAERVRRYRGVLECKRSLREVYLRWYENIARSLAAAGPTVEIGTGHGLMRELFPQVIATDVFSSPYTDLACDAMRLPFADGSVGNFVMVDVLHHIKRPARAFCEFARCLKPAGRVIVSEPYLSPVARFVFRFHSERVDFDVNISEAGAWQQADGHDPFEGNMAISHKALVTETERFLGSTPDLRLRSRYLSDWLVYPLSGGFNYPALVPGWAAGPLLAVEAKARFINRLAAFKIAVVFERQG